MEKQKRNQRNRKQQIINIHGNDIVSLCDNNIFYNVVMMLSFHVVMTSSIYMAMKILLHLVVNFIIKFGNDYLLVMKV